MDIKDIVNENIDQFRCFWLDWENINNNPLWKAGKYDEAVLSEMGLKWQGDTIVKS